MPHTFLEFIAAPLLIALACYILNLLGVISILVGSGAAALLALLCRLATAYAAALAAHSLGHCGAGSILVGGQSAPLKTAALALLAGCAAVWGGRFLCGHAPSRTRYPWLARLSFGLALAACIAQGELGTTPPTELLANYWSAQRVQGLAALQQMRAAEMLNPNPLLTGAWVLLHQSCFKAFVIAAYSCSAALGLCFLVGALRGGQRKAHGD